MKLKVQNIYSGQKQENQKQELQIHAITCNS